MRSSSPSPSPSAAPLSVGRNQLVVVASAPSLVTIIASIFLFYFPKRGIFRLNDVINNDSLLCFIFIYCIFIELE